MSDNQYIKSTAPGKHWSLYTHKPDGRPGYAIAVEGDLTDKSFSYVMFEARQVRCNVAGRMTVKNRNAALQSLWKTMQKDGLIAEGESLQPVT